MTLEVSISDQEMGEIKGQVFKKTGLDLSYFKPSFLERRINVRMKMLNITSGSEYAELLTSELDEVNSLYSSLSINVTKFYRDKRIWKTFSNNVIPNLLEEIKPSETIRIWSAGCASGEEPYSLAIMFSEALKNSTYRFRILASDINSKSIREAKNGVYTLETLKNLEPNLISKYFTKIRNDQYKVNQKIKVLITYNSGDIVTFPKSYLDVIFCRNLLIYYGKDAQDLIFKKFYNVLKDNRFLVLGMDETMWGHKISNSFVTINPRDRIYQKKSVAK